MIRRLRTARIVLLLTAALASVLGWQRVSGWYSQSMREKAQNEIAWTASPMEAGAVFYLALDRPTGQSGALLTFGLCRLPLATDAEASGTEASINTIDEDLTADAVPDAMDGTQEEGPAQYVLFLPGAVRKTGLRVHFREELSLDGQPLVTGQLLELAEGEHLIQTPDGEWPFTAVYGSELPCMFIETETGNLETIHRDKACVEGAGVTLLKMDGTVAYGGWIDEMRGRGNSTWGYSEKKPYQITLAERASLLGMPAAKRWVLLANAYDPTLLCNQTVFSIAQSAGMPYTPESRQVELYINGEYRGCYLLSEKVEVDENRVNIPDTDELNAAVIAKIKSKQAARYRKSSKSMPGGTRFIYYQLPAGVDAATGGYLVELDFLFRVEETNHAYYVTRNEKALDIKCPALATEQQAEYIAALFQQLEDIVIPPDDSTDDSSEALSRLVDLHSLQNCSRAQYGIMIRHLVHPEYWKNRKAFLRISPRLILSGAASIVSRPSSRRRGGALRMNLCRSSRRC